jgi:hypothetical protein
MIEASRQASAMAMAPRPRQANNGIPDSYDRRRDQLTLGELRQGQPAKASGRASRAMWSSTAFTKPFSRPCG